MRKILELENYTSPQDSDVLPIVDTANTTTKKISISLLKTVFKSHEQNSDTNLGTLGTKTTPVDNDKVVYRNSESSDTLATSTWTQIKSFLKTYFDTLYSAITHNHDSSYAPLTHASRHAVGATDSIFPADPNADKYLKWNDFYGTLQWSDATFNQVQFTSSGTWTVPSGVKKIMVFAIGGGGGGGGVTGVSGGGGGTTFVEGSVSGILFFVVGGGGGGGTDGTTIGTAGISYSGVAGNSVIRSIDFSSSTFTTFSGFGSGSPFGGGGRSVYSSDGEAGGGYGTGGSGAGNSNNNSYSAGGGGSADCVLGYVCSVSPGETLTVTIGAAGGAGGSGNSGKSGFVRIVYIG